LSASEEISHLLCANKVGYFSAEEILPINQKCQKVIEDLNKLIKSLNLNSVLHAHPQPQP
jgi:hypothetical protein